MTGRMTLRRLRTWTVTSLAVLLTTAGITAGAPPTEVAASATVDGSTRHQPIDGFGISEHFGRAEIMRGSQGLPPERQREILDLLFSKNTGVGLSILRLGIDSGIQPTDPGGPNATPKYVWGRNDKGRCGSPSRPRRTV
jgi:glucuronoarabinoxylan endo-1,4-beta-xylanase